MVSVRILTLFLSAVALVCGQSQLGQSPPPVRALTPEEHGDVFMARKMYREAIEAYREGPKSAVIWNKIGIAFHQLGNLDSARKNYEMAIKTDRKYADAVNNLGTIYYAQKNYRAATSRYKKAIQLAPEKASYWSNLGTAWYSRGKFEEMTAAYQKALSLDRDIFEHRGTVGTELQDRTVADRARYHFVMARMYAQNGQNDLALQYLRRALEEGLKDKTKIVEAKEFAALRDTDEFKELMALEPRVL